ncbi:haloacid dehalogenase-like hydrolase [Corallococcus sp. H22C18031201]|nr:haloacid dehalogenase-like hydrolase [Corallococcus sp. H22C18031201]
MKTEPVTQTLERIRAEFLRTPGGVLAFDADGTLWSGDVGDDLFLALLEHGDLQPEVHEALEHLCLAHGVDTASDDRELARRLFAAHEAGRLPEHELYAMQAWLFAGWRAEDVRAFARDVVTRVRVESRVHPETRRVLTWAQTEGVDCYIVSASPRAVVEAAVGPLGLSPERVLACTPREAAGRLRPSVEEPIPYGPGKVRCLRARTAQPLHAAFGDNLFDLEMLAAARIPVAIRPKPRLQARAEELPAMVQLLPET